MKKSNRVLIGIFIFVLGGLTAYNILIASVLKTIPDNGTSKFGYLSQSETVKQFEPFNQIKVVAEGSPEIFISQSNTHEMSIGEGYSKYLIIDNANETLTIKIKKPEETVQEVLHIKVPQLNAIVVEQTAQRLENVGALVLYLDKLRLRDLSLNMFYPYGVMFRNCDIGNLKIQGKLKAGNYSGKGINIESTTRLDSLQINLEGKGTLTLSKAGESYNLVTLSDSIQLIAGMPVLRKIFGK
jgi:hypothetical protein